MKTKMATGNLTGAIPKQRKLSDVEVKDAINDLELQGQLLEKELRGLTPQKRRETNDLDILREERESLRRQVEKRRSTGERARIVADIEELRQQLVALPTGSSNNNETVTLNDLRSMHSLSERVDLMMPSLLEATDPQNEGMRPHLWETYINIRSFGISTRFNCF